MTNENRAGLTETVSSFAAGTVRAFVSKVREFLFAPDRQIVQTGEPWRERDNRAIELLDRADQARARRGWGELGEAILGKPVTASEASRLQRRFRREFPLL